MNHEQEAGSAARADLTAKERLEQAIQDYVNSLEPDEDGRDPGILTGWFLVMEQQNVVDGSSSYSKAVRDHQSLATTLGLIIYSDEKYRNKVRAY